MKSQKVSQVIHALELSLKHIRRLSVVYVKCHDNCLCNGVCEHPDRIHTIRVEELLRTGLDIMYDELNGVEK